MSGDIVMVATCENKSKYDNYPTITWMGVTIGLSVGSVDVFMRQHGVIIHIVYLARQIIVSVGGMVDNYHTMWSVVVYVLVYGREWEMIKYKRKENIRNGGLLCIVGREEVDVHISNVKLVGYCVGWRYGCFKYKLVDIER